MNQKRIIAAILVIAILVSQFSWLSFAMPKAVYADSVARVSEQSNIAEKYFYNQLTDEAKVFYDAIDEMFLQNDYSKIIEELRNPSTKFGVDSKELTDKFDNQGNALAKSLYSKLEAYTKGNQELLNLMAAARDAWMADHASAFYVDSSNITLRVTKEASNQKLHVFIGIGRTKTYINKAFWDSETNKVKTNELITALELVEREKDRIVGEVQKVVPQAGQSLQEQQARKAHDLIILENSYKLEETIIEENKTQGKHGDPFSVRNVYGAFGPSHEIVCEGFARAFKMIMDEVNIPCILVYGAYVSNTSYEEHMWNYIQLEDEKWYGVDVTWDNTDEIENQGYDGNNERISTEYFVAGSEKMDLNHLVTGTMSAAKYEFQYPTLEVSSDRYVIATENAGLSVEIDAESYDEEDQIQASKLRISYAVDLNENGIIDPGERMGYTEAKKHGYYFVSKFLAYNDAKVDEANPGSHQYGQSGESWSGSSFYGYILPEIYDSIIEETAPNGDSYIVFLNANSQFMQFGVTDVKPLDMSEVKTASDIEKLTTYFGTSADLLAVSDMVFNPHGDYIAAPYIKRATPVLNSTMLIGSTYHCEVEYDDVLIPAKDKTLADVRPEVTIEYSSNEGRNDFELTNFKFDGKSTFTFDFTPSEQYADDAIFYNISFTNLIGEQSGKPPMVVNWFCAHRCEAFAYKSQGFDWNVYGKPTLMDDVNLDELSEDENDELSDLLKHRLTLVTTTTKPSEEKAMTDLLNAKDTLDSSTGDKLDIGGTIEKTETYNIKLTLCKKQKIQDGQKVRIMLGFPAGYGPEDAGVTFKAYHYKKDKSGRIIGVEEIPCMVTELGLVIECDDFSPFTIATIKTDSPEKVVSNKRTILFQSSDGGEVYIKGEKANSVVLDAEENTEVTLTIKPDEGFVVDDVVVGNTVEDINGDERRTALPSNEVTYTLKYEDLKEQEYDALVAKVAFIPQEKKEEETGKGYEVVAQPNVAQAEFELATTTGKVVTGDKETIEQVNSYKEGDTVEVTYKLTGMTAVEKNIEKITAFLKYNTENLQYVDGSIKTHTSWSNFSATPTETGVLKIEGTSSSSSKSSQIGEVFTLRFKVLQDVDTIETLVLSEIKGGDGDGSPVCSDVATNIQINKKPTAVEDKIEATGDVVAIEDNLIIGVDPKSTINDLAENLTASGNRLITFYGNKLGLDGEGNVVASGDVNELLKLSTKLTGDDILSTGSTARIGNKTYTIVISGDVDGDGDLTINDITTATLNDIEEVPFIGVYKQASDIDRDGDLTINDITDMMLYHIGEIETLGPND